MQGFGLTGKEAGRAGHGGLRKSCEGRGGGRDPFGSGSCGTGARAGGRESVRGGAREDDGVWGALEVRGALVLGAWPPGRAGTGTLLGLGGDGIPDVLED